MILKTYQHPDALRKMLETGSLRVNEAYLTCGEELRFAYDWLAGQICERIGEPPEGVTYPVWLWYRWEGKKICPEKKQFTSEKEPLVRITADIPKELVLLSDFDMWHSVLNNDYVAMNDDDYEAFAGGRREIEASWPRILLPSAAAGYYSREGEESIQANVWEIKREWVRKVEYLSKRS